MSQEYQSSRFAWFLPAAVVAVILRAVLGIATWQPGWSALTWDDFTRVAIAQEWAADPFYVESLVWLPLPVWITGSIYWLIGDAFLSSPMALMAIINTTAVIVSAMLIAAAAHVVFRDRVGTFLVFLLALFSPWGYFLSLSGLAEPLYFVAIALAVLGLVSWAQSDRTWHLAVGSLGVAAAAAMRYEGWWLVVAWGVVIAVDSLVLLRSASFGDVLRRRWAAVVVAGAPALVPLAWLVTNTVKEGNPTFFAEESARYFRNAYGSFSRIRDRVLYYPISLVRAAPLLVIAEAIVAFVERRRREVMLLIALFATQFALFYVSSSLSGALGAFPERFLFAFVLGLMPLMAAVPAIVRRVVPRPAIAVVSVVLVAVAGVVTVTRMLDRPEEWTHAPDLLELNEQLGAIAGDGLLVIAGTGMESDLLPLGVQNGDRVGVSVSESPQFDIGDAAIWAERNPQRVLDFGLPIAPAVGRFRLEGLRASSLGTETCRGCEGWLWEDEEGVERRIGGGPYLGLEFITDDPAPGARTSLVKAIERTSADREATLDLRWLYGHGFNLGRMMVVVALDGVVLFETDVGESSRWTEVDFVVPAGSGEAELRIEVVALPGIEPGWAWGRASTVLVREFEVESP